MPKQGFMDLLPTLRNQIYESYASDVWDRPVIMTDNLDCRSIPTSLNLWSCCNAFPSPSLAKQIMHEGIAYYPTKPRPTKRSAHLLAHLQSIATRCQHPLTDSGHILVRLWNRLSAWKLPFALNVTKTPIPLSSLHTK